MKNKKQWIETAMNYINKYAEKVVLETTDDTTVFGFRMSARVLEDALNGRKD